MNGNRTSQAWRGDVVVGYSVRPEGRAAIDRAFIEAKIRKADLHIVRSVSQYVNENPSRAQSWAEQMSLAEEQGEALIEDLGSEEVGVEFILDTVKGDAGEAILDVAARTAAGLIVIGVRRRSPVGKLVLGSVAQDVLLRADCPVLAVKYDTGSAAMG